MTSAARCAGEVRRRLTSIQRKGGERTAALLNGQMVRIWSGQWGAWWRPEARGYTDKSSLAWVVPFSVALDHTCHCGPEKQIAFVVVAPAAGLAGAEVEPVDVPRC